MKTTISLLLLSVSSFVIGQSNSSSWPTSGTIGNARINLVSKLINLFLKPVPMLKYIGIICFAALFLVSCKKEQPQMTPLNQECDCAKEVSAEFTMEEKSGSMFTNTDTVYFDKNVYFTANEEGAEYTWYIGSEILHGKQIARFFSKNLMGQTLPISLVVKKKPNKICLPNDDGYDSIVKYITIVDIQFNDPFRPDLENDPKHQFEGFFRVKEQNGTDSLDIEIEIAKQFPGQLYYLNFAVFGLKQDTTLYTQIYGVNYRQLSFNSILFLGDNDNCFDDSPMTNNYIFIPTWKEIEIKLTANEGTDCKSVTYKGRRL